MGGAGIERHDGRRVPASHALPRGEERRALARRRAGHPQLPARRRQLGDVSRCARRSFHQHRMLLRAQARRGPCRWASPGPGARFHPRTRRNRPGANVHAHLARPLRPVELGRAPGDAAGADAPARLGALQHLSLFFLGARHHRSAAAADERPAGAAGARRGAARRAARSGGSATAAARRHRPALPRDRHRPARLPPPAVPPVPPARPQGGRTMDPRPPGGGRKLGRDPAAVGVFADSAERARPSTRPPRAGEGSRGHARPLDASPRGREGAGAGVFVPGLGYGALAARAARVGRRAVRFDGGAGRTVAAAGGDPRSRRLVRAGPRRGTERMGVRVRERSLSRRRRHGGRRSGATGAGNRRCRGSPRARLAGRYAVPQRRLGRVRRRQ